MLSSYENTVAILLSLLEKNLLKSEAIVAATPEQLSAAIKGDGNFDAGNIANNVMAMAQAMNALEYIPTRENEFLDCGIDPYVVNTLMQDVFGATDLIIGLNIRKVVVAIDLIDWEELEVERRSDVKMKLLTDTHVKHSVLTWLPKGLGVDFQKAFEKVGEAIGNNKIGFQGKLNACINKHFKPAKKDKLTAMRDAILRYYKATKCGAKKQYQF